MRRGAEDKKIVSGAERAGPVACGSSESKGFADGDTPRNKQC